MNTHFCSILERKGVLEEGRALRGSRGGVGDKGPQWVPFTHLGYDCVGPGCMFVVATSK